MKTKILTVLALLLAMPMVLAGSIEGDISETCTAGNPNCQNNALEYHSGNPTIDADSLEGDSLGNIYDYVDDADEGLQGQIDDLEVDITNINSEILGLNGEINDLWDQVDENEDDIARNLNLIRQNRNRIRNLRSRLNGLNVRLNGFIRIATRWSHSVERRLDDLQNQIDDLNDDLIDLESRISDLEDRMDIAEDNIDTNVQEITNTNNYINNNEQDWTKDSIGMKFAKFWKVLLNWERPVDDRTALRRGTEILDEFDSVENYLYNQFKLKLMEEIYSGVYEKEFAEFIAEKQETTTTTTLKPKVIPPTVEELDCEDDEQVRAIYSEGEIVGYKCWTAESGNQIPVINGPIKLN